MATITKALSPEELRELDLSGLRYEIVDGEVRVSPAGLEHGDITVRLLVRLAAFVEKRGLGRVFDSSTGFRLPGGNLRAPDVAFVAKHRLPSGKLPRKHGDMAPDLVVEVLSPDASPRQVLDKVGEYLAAGTRLIWVIDPKREAAAVYRSLTDVAHVPADGVLDGGGVLRGFRMPLGELFL